MKRNNIEFSQPHIPNFHLPEQNPMKEDKIKQDEIERRRLQEYIFGLEEIQEKAEDLSKKHEVLKHTQELLNAILSATTHGICLIKMDKFVWCNKGFTDIIGWDHDELVGKTIEVLFPDIDAYKKINDLIQKDLPRTGMLTFDYDFAHKNGGRVACLVTGRPLDDIDISRGYIFSFTDFSERKRAEEDLKKAHDKLEKRVEERTRDLHRINEQLNLELKERKRAEEELQKNEVKYKALYEDSKRAEEVYRSLIHSSADAIVIYDMEGMPKYLSPSFTQIFGWTLEEVEGKRIPFLPESEKPTTIAIINDLIINGTPYHGYETKRRTKDGRILDVSISASRYNDHKRKPAGMLVVIRDISKRKRLEAQFQQAQKMESIGTLAGGVAHDLNNLLSGLVSYPELLLLQLPEDSFLRKPLLTIQKSGEKAAAVVQDLLTLARRGVVVTEVVNPNDIISEYLESPEYEKLQSYHPGVHLETHLTTDTLNILGSSTHLYKAVMNLVSNAAEAMPVGGKIIVTTENRYIDRPIRGYDNVKEGDYVV
ncbi:MAG: PAS domain S-box protein, partial [Deltaproteobacteria bacterium]|nr:PAS domain S-box protein [Deltaproteobacteria bacterium]